AKWSTPRAAGSWAGDGGGNARERAADAILAVFAENPLASHGHRLQSQEEDRSHRLRAEARSSGHQAQRRQHGAPFALSHRHQERAEGGRRRRQGQGRRALQDRTADHRLGRRQEPVPQEQGRAPQEPPRRQGEGAGNRRLRSPVRQEEKARVAGLFFALPKGDLAARPAQGAPRSGCSMTTSSLSRAKFMTKSHAIGSRSRSFGLTTTPLTPPMMRGTQYGE